tara:strand:- start:2289 stop:2420 length:132 start_codon:yes stop_codon:yes gene_type:complete
MYPVKTLFRIPNTVEGRDVMPIRLKKSGIFQVTNPSKPNAGQN